MISRVQSARPMTVDEVATRVKNLLAYDSVFSGTVSVTGEVTDFKRHVSGHVYFTIKGQKAYLSCVMFRSYAYKMLLWPQVGDSVLVSGNVNYYEARGTVQLYARKITPLGEGAAARAKALLKKKLEAEGLFDAARKRPLPRYPKRVVCVTSPTGAAVRDVIRQYKTRMPNTELIISPCLVQGDDAPESAACAMRKAYSLGADVIILVRGGGSKEDLNPFDDEELVREVARSPIPVVTGIGHEVDTSLCDLAADLVQPTPTAAATAVFRDRAQESANLKAMSDRADILYLSYIRASRKYAESLSEKLTKGFYDQIGANFQYIDVMRQKAASAVKSRIASERIKLDALSMALKNLSPAELSRRGYCVVTSGEKRLRSIGELKIKDAIEVHLLDGKASASVTGIAKLK